MTASSPNESEPATLAGRHRGTEAVRQRRQFYRVVHENPREPLLVAMGLFAGCLVSWDQFKTGGLGVGLGLLAVLATALLLVSYVAQFTVWFDQPKWFGSRVRRGIRRAVVHFWWVAGVVVVLTGFLSAV